VTTSTQLYDSLFTAQSIRDAFSARATVQGMLDFENALARAQAQVGVIPAEHAATISAKCRAELFDVDALANAATKAGNVAIPLIKALTALVAKENESAARYVHWGATSQDAIDTGMVLQLKQTLDFFDAKLLQLSDACAVHADKHRHTIMVGRTWLQHATPITFGLKAAGWLSAIERHRTRMAECRTRLLVIQFGGASGTLASLGERGLEVAKELARELKLNVPAASWHTQRDSFVEFASVSGMLNGSLGKIARDISFMMQTEIGEAFEPAEEGRGGSSTMPHKRNPVSCAVVLSAATRLPGLVSTMLSAMPQEHERGLGGWHAEWETLAQICQITSGALEHTVFMLKGLEIDAARMRANLDITQGLIFAEAASMALATHFGREKAHQLIELACQEAISTKRHLRDVLAKDAQVSSQLNIVALEKIFDAKNYLGVAEPFIDRVLAARKQ
jgi:3-carboxy-cis,cis-muconate cycloisomerase